jgi:hypothetical protein
MAEDGRSLESRIGGRGPPIETSNGIWLPTFADA